MPDLITVDEAALELHVHRNTIYNNIKRGKLVAWKNDNGWKISWQSVCALRENGYNDRLGLIATAVRAVSEGLNSFATPMSINRVAKLDSHLCVAHRMLQCNEAFKKLLGLTEEIIKRTECFHRFVHPDDLTHLPSHQNIEMKPNSRWEADFRWRRPSSPSNQHYTWIKTKGLLVHPSEDSHALISINEFHPVCD